MFFVYPLIGLAMLIGAFIYRADKWVAVAFLLTGLVSVVSSLGILVSVDISRYLPWLIAPLMGLCLAIWSIFRPKQSAGKPAMLIGGLALFLPAAPMIALGTLLIFGGSGRP